MASESGGNVGRYWAVTGGLVAAVLGVAFYRPLPPVLSARFSPADIHSEYVKYLSGPDTITAYLAYPERPDPAPAVIVIHDIYGMGDRLRPAVGPLARPGFLPIG